MTTMDLNAAQASDYSGLAPYTINSESTDGATGIGETSDMHNDFEQNYGYFTNVPDLKSALILKSVWNVGRGYKAISPADQVILDHLKGSGKDSFKDILFNMDLMSSIAGDSFAEIVKEKGVLINLKPLDPGSIRIVYDEHGMIKRYEQVTKLTSKGRKKVVAKFKPEEIFHLYNYRTADSILGLSDIKGLEPVILGESESFEDMKKLSHFQAKPFIIFKLKTDDTTKIAAFAEKIKNARGLGEDMFVPDDENLLEYEVVQVNPSQFLLAWRDDLRNKFYRAIGLPQIVPGGGGQSADSESKAILLAFEQIIENRQLYIEEQVWNQLQIKIDLEHPTLISDLLQPQVQQDGAGNLGAKPSELDPTTEI